MVSKILRFKFRRRLKRTKQGVEQFQNQTMDQLDKHIVRRWQKFAHVRRFVFGWLILIGLLLVGVLVQISALASYYIEDVPAPGGIYSEGMVGKITNLNPIFSSSPADSAISSLIFDPLVRYDDQDNIVGALAKSWKVSDDGTIYTVKLRNDVFWHDGKDFSSRDVAYTFSAIQDADSRSPLNRSWQGVKVEALDEQTVRFILPNPFTPFLHALTEVRILPSHVLEEIPSKELRAHKFNLAPSIGTGPFVFNGITLSEDIGRVRLKRFDRYYAGKVNLDEIRIVSYTSYERMLEEFNDGEITGVAGLRIQDLDKLDNRVRYKLSQPLTYNNVGLFFNNSRSIFKNAKFRQAILRFIKPSDVVAVLGYHFPVSSSPLLKGQLGYNDSLKQFEYDPETAAKLMREIGYAKDKDSIWARSGEQLKLSLIAQNTDEYPAVAAELQRQLRQAGIILNVKFVDTSEFHQSYIVPHNYGMVLAGLNQGVDPDIFPFWHSSEASFGGFNLSEYKSKIADAALEAGRTRRDRNLRSAKYHTFLRAWRKDAPAVMLYRPAYLYVQLEVVKGFSRRTLPEPVNRFDDIINWTINSRKQPKPL